MSEATNETKCVLTHGCKNAGIPQHCNGLCGAFIAVHGSSGLGGRVGAANVPKDYRLTTLANSPAREGQVQIYATIEKYVATFGRQFDEATSAKERIKSLYLYSESPGTGKSTTASAVLNEWIIAHYIGSLKRSRQALQQPAYFLDCNDWQTLYNGFARQGIPRDVAEPNSREYYRRMELAKKAPFAVLDDIGVRDATDGFRGDLHSVINHRVTNQLPTVFTSNVALGDLTRVFGEERLVDRMRDLTLEITFGGASKRGMRR